MIPWGQLPIVLWRWESWPSLSALPIYPACKLYLLFLCCSFTSTTSSSFAPWCLNISTILIIHLLRATEGLLWHGNATSVIGRTKQLVRMKQPDRDSLSLQESNTSAEIPARYSLFWLDLELMDQNTLTYTYWWVMTQVTRTIYSNQIKWSVSVLPKKKIRTIYSQHTTIY